MDQRISHIDVMKGILIIMVVLGHICYCIKINTNAELIAYPYILTQTIANNWIAPYYMAAFFCITGFCSSFSNSLAVQVKKDLRRLIIPAICIPIIMRLFIPPYVLEMQMTKYIKYLDLPWFLMAMFWSKIMFKIIKERVKLTLAKWGLLFFMSCFGILLMIYMKDYNHEGLFQSFVFTFFLAVGHYMRGKEIHKLFLIASGVFYLFSVLFLTRGLHLGCPALCAIITFDKFLIPMYFLMAITGTIIIYKVSCMIGGNSLLEYLGKNSLIIYLTHYTFITIASILLKNYIASVSSEILPASFIVLLMLIGGIAWGGAWTCFLNCKHLKWIIGKL